MISRCCCCVADGSRSGAGWCVQTGMVTDEDIDAIIAKGEADTAALNNKLQEYTENAMKFTMDGGGSRPRPPETRRSVILVPFFDSFPGMWDGMPALRAHNPSACGGCAAVCMRVKRGGAGRARQGCRRTSTRTPTPWRRRSSWTTRPSQVGARPSSQAHPGPAAPNSPRPSLPAGPPSRGGGGRGAGANWVDPPKRERKRMVNYAENEYFRQAMKPSAGGARQSGPRLPKMPQMNVSAPHTPPPLPSSRPLPLSRHWMPPR